MSITSSTARIEVSDDGSGQPVLREPGHDHGGNGLWLVGWLAQAWGTGPGVTVWLTLPLTGAEQP